MNVIEIAMQNNNSNQYSGNIFFLLNCSALILTLLIVFLSTHIRLGEAGLGCDPWPECYAQLSLADGIKGLEIPDTEFRTFRAMHRAIASILGINILIILFIALWYRKAISPVLPVLMFLVVLFLSILGIVTPTRSVPVVTLGNILGGIVLAGLVWRQILRTRIRSTQSGPLILLILSATVTLQLISGAWASANYTGSACPGLVTCTYMENTSSHLLDSYNILRELKLDNNHHLIIDEASSIIQITHRVIAIILLLLVFTALQIIRHRHPVLVKPMLILTCILCAEFILGIVNTLTDMPLWTNTLHNLLAVGLLFAMINLTMLVKLKRADN
jgi:cytochrome c oxidase assembly protein subunit 15